MEGGLSREFSRESERAIKRVDMYARMLEDAEEVLTNPEKREDEPMKELDRLRNAEIVLKTAEYVKTIEEGSRVSIEEIVLPESPQAIKELAGEGGARSKFAADLMRVPLSAPWSTTTPESGQDAILEAAARALNGRLAFYSSTRNLAARLYPSDELRAGVLQELRRKQHEVIARLPEQLPAALKDFSPGVVEKIVASAATVELNQGCSVGCAFCAYSAERKVRSVMPSAEATWLVRRSNDKAFYYGATDPLDYQDPNDPNFDYASLMTIAEGATGQLPFTSTAYPHGKAGLVRRLGDRISRWSVSYMNKRRLLADEVFVERAPGVLLPADDEVFASMLFGSVHDIERKLVRLKGPYASVPSASNFQNSVHPGIGMYLFNDAGDAGEYKAAGRQRNIAARRGQDVPSAASTIHCVQGTLVTPESVMNTMPLFSTEQSPNGRLDIPLKPEELGAGQQELERLHERLKAGEEIRMADVLRCGIVEWQYGSIALFYPNAEEAAKQRFVQKDFATGKILKDPETGRWASRQYSPETIPHELEVVTYDERGSVLQKWRCQYNLVNAQLLQLHPVT